MSYVPDAEPVVATVILQVLPALDGGGVERGTVEMAQAIAGAGGVALVASAGGRLVPRSSAPAGAHLPLPLRHQEPAGGSGATRRCWRR